MGGPKAVQIANLKSWLFDVKQTTKVLLRDIRVGGFSVTRFDYTGA